MDKLVPNCGVKHQFWCVHLDLLNDTPPPVFLQLPRCGPGGAGLSMNGDITNRYVMNTCCSNPADLTAGVMLFWHKGDERGHRFCYFNLTNVLRSISSIK